MPFTLAHAAAALPLKRATSLPFAGLAVGAMSPDFEYYLAVGRGRTIGHQLHGLVLLDLPLALAFLALCYWLLVPGVIMLLPQRMTHLATPLRAWSPPLRPGSGLGRLCTAILVGAGSHVLWDSFTHSHRSAGGLGWLEHHVIHLGHRSIYVHDLMQMGSSVVGMGVLAWAALRWYRQQNPVDVHPPHVMQQPALIAFTTFVLCAMAIVAHAVGSNDSLRLVVLLAVSAITLTVASLSTLGVAVRLQQATQRLRS